MQCIVSNAHQRKAPFVSTNFMTSYRITKYNPQNRNEQGHYLDSSEWTAISDIGKPEYNNVTYEEYEKTESAYVEAITSIMHDNNLNFVKVDSLELPGKKQDFINYERTGRLKNINVDFEKEVKGLQNGLQLDITKIEKIIRLILRETIHMLLVNDEFEIRFGYDYYMYVKAKNLKQSTIEKIQRAGLFVESGIEQMKYIITDSDRNEI